MFFFFIWVNKSFNFKINRTVVFTRHIMLQYHRSFGLKLYCIVFSYSSLIAALCLYQKQRACQASISLGQTVISKHKNLRYYSSKVTQITSQTFYEVMFDDGSFSNDTYPEDIVVRICLITDTLKRSPPSCTRSYQILKPSHFERRFLFSGKIIGLQMAIAFLPINLTCFNILL